MQSWKYYDAHCLGISQNEIKGRVLKKMQFYLRVLSFHLGDYQNEATMAKTELLFPNNVGSNEFHI